MSMDSHLSVSSTASSGTGSRSTVYVPPIADIPEMSAAADDDLYDSESDHGRANSSSSGTGKYLSLLLSPSASSGSGARRPSTFISLYHSHTVDDTVINGDEYVYCGDSHAIPSHRLSSRSLRRSGSMTDLGSDALQSNRSSAHEESNEQFFTAGMSSTAQRSSVYSSAELYSLRTGTGTGTGTRTFTGLTSSGLAGTGMTGTYMRTGTWTGTETGTRVSETTRFTRTSATSPGT
ncbi:hypothetical protein BT96DRAFT_1002154 [Gymnopus androsaceus JB14]|uniref:Uncharacterized protein n=1 Tax=Gymnopus androsaceus JB14 TaxID=1447944 RepID=A0A6A4GXW0_9AGAR|nr:hypothetical protein BT96DRAFT_1002154 [Gymnopus androsaceus JB14]